MENVTNSRLFDFCASGLFPYQLGLGYFGQHQQLFITTASRLLAVAVLLTAKCHFDGSPDGSKLEAEESAFQR